MKIEDLQETAALAHLNMDEKELEGAFPAFEQMLGYFAAMQAADKDQAAFPAGFGSSAAGVSAVSRTVPSSHFRSDTHNPSGNSGESLIDNSSGRDGPFVVIPNVL
jgi:aspartyl-tRNA(Asn)/glutamyl-tRNA(Gln) amidotransferase subunit C